MGLIPCCISRITHVGVFQWRATTLTCGNIALLYSSGWSVSLNSYLTIIFLNKIPIIKFHQDHKAVFLIWQALTRLVIMLLLIILFTATCYACCCNGRVVVIDFPLHHSCMFHFYYHTRWMHCFPFSLSFVHSISQWSLDLTQTESPLHKSITEHPQTKVCNHVLH